MSLNKGKAKVKAKSKSVAKSAGKNKAAVMNSRDPKKPMAISGDTMSNYAMYKKGGKVKKSLPKAQKGMSKGRIKYERNKQGFIEGTNGRLGIESAGMNTAQELSKTAGYALGSLITGDIDPAKNYIKRKLGIKKKGGSIKKYKSGGTTKAKKFAALAPPYDKITAADRIAGAKKNARKK